MSPSPALIIEDDDDIRRLLEVVLTQAGFSISSAPTAEAGIDAASGGTHALITVDLGLPDVDGLDVLKTLRPLTDAKLVVISARSADRDRDASLAAGADAFLTKPFRPRELKDAIARVLSAGA